MYLHFCCPCLHQVFGGKKSDSEPNSNRVIYDSNRQEFSSDNDRSQYAATGKKGRRDLERLLLKADKENICKFKV